MDEQSLADLAREYGLDPSEYEDEEAIFDYPHSTHYEGNAAYNEIEDYVEEPGNVLAYAPP